MLSEQMRTLAVYHFARARATQVTGASNQGMLRILPRAAEPYPVFQMIGACSTLQTACDAGR